MLFITEEWKHRMNWSIRNFMAKNHSTENNSPTVSCLAHRRCFNFALLGRSSVIQSIWRLEKKNAVITPASPFVETCLKDRRAIMSVGALRRLCDKAACYWYFLLILSTCFIGFFLKCQRSTNKWIWRYIAVAWRLTRTPRLTCTFWACRLRIQIMCTF